MGRARRLLSPASKARRDVSSLSPCNEAGGPERLPWPRSVLPLLRVQRRAMAGTGSPAGDGAGAQQCGTGCPGVSPAWPGNGGMKPAASWLGWERSPCGARRGAELWAERRRDEGHHWHKRRRHSPGAPPPPAASPCGASSPSASGFSSATVKTQILPFCSVNQVIGLQLMVI